MTTYNNKDTKIGQGNCPENQVLNYGAIHIAYNLHKIEQPLNNEHEKYLSELNGWKLLSHSLIHSETSAYDLKAAVFINPSEKALHFAFAGTNPTSYYDLLDDCYVYFHKMINKLNPMQLLINEVDKVIGLEEVVSYSISSSGHSLGGVVSELFAAEMLSRGRNFVTSTTFDSPGSRPIVEQAIQNNLLTGSKELCLNDVSEHCKVFLAPKNFINSTNPQLAHDIKLIVPHNIKQNEHEYGKLGWSIFLYDMLGAACSTVANFLGISNLIKGLDGHKLSNFANYENLALAVSQWIEYNKQVGYYNPTPIISEEDNPGLTLKLKDTQPDAKKDVLLEFQEDDYIMVDLISSSQLAELQSAQSSKENNAYNTGGDNKWEDLSEDLEKEFDDDGYCSGGEDIENNISVDLEDDNKWEDLEKGFDDDGYCSGGEDIENNISADLEDDDEREDASEDLVTEFNNSNCTGNEDTHQRHIVELNSQELAGNQHEVDLSIM